jgi:uroporphyrinogen decarboxylase
LQRGLLSLVRQAYKEKRRLIAPLIGFPGINIVGSTIKLAQQNFKEHYKVLKSITEIFKPDVIFPLMDLSVEANALGCLTVFPKEESATVIKDKFALSDIEKLENIDIAYDSRVLAYVQTIKLLKKNISPRILKGAYVTGPYTLAALMMGAEEAAFSVILKPDELDKLCEFTTRKIIDYINLLIAAGTRLICILEPSAVMLAPEQFELFSVKYVKSISAHCNDLDVSTIYHICGNTMHLVEKMSESGVDALSLDSSEAGVNIQAVARLISEDIILIGNVSPIGFILRGRPEEVKEEVIELLRDMEPYPNFILSTGCDLPQETPIENILAFMDAGRNYHCV